MVAIASLLVLSAALERSGLVLLLAITAYVLVTARWLLPERSVASP